MAKSCISKFLNYVAIHDDDMFRVRYKGDE